MKRTLYFLICLSNIPSFSMEIDSKKLEKLNPITVIKLEHQSKNKTRISTLCEQIRTNQLPGSTSVCLGKKKKLVSVNKGITGDIEQVNENSCATIFCPGAGYNLQGGETLPFFLHSVEKDYIHTPCISFDFPTKRTTVNFSQGGDQKALKRIYNETNKQYDNIILMGLCRGASTILRFVSKYHPENVKGLILESPFNSFKTLIQKLAQNHVGWFPYSRILAYKVVNIWFPSYKSKQDTLLQEIKKIPTDMPIFIGHLKEDAYVSDQSMLQLIKKLRAFNDSIYLLVIQDQMKGLAHSQLTLSRIYKKAVNAFLAMLDAPHNPKLARKGGFLIEIAQKNAQVDLVEDWQVVYHE